MNRAWHHEQARPDSCVAACMCIIQRARGEPPTEDAFRQLHARHPLGSIAHIPRVRILTSARANERELMVELSTGALVVIVTVLSSPYVTWQRRRYPSLSTRHGPLAPPGQFGGGLHAIALVGRILDGFRALDPYFAAHDPLAIDDDAFASFFAGHAVVADP